MKHISTVPASYKGLPFPELSLPTHAAQHRNNGISLARNSVSWHRQPALLWKSGWHTGTVLLNSLTRYPASGSQEKGNWMQVFGGRITTLIYSHHLPLCGYPSDRNDLGNLLHAWCRYTSVLVRFKRLTWCLKNRLSPANIHALMQTSHTRHFTTCLIAE